MRQVEFYRRININSIKPRLMGLRHQPFTNIDGETFGKPTLNGFWQFEVAMSALREEDMLAMSAFITDMRGHATTLLPLSNQWGPVAYSGRLVGFLQGPDWESGHVGFQAQPYDQVTLQTAAFARDSYIEIDKPDDVQIRPGQYITLGDRLHQIVAASALNESDEEMRLTLRPSLRENYDPGDVVIVDYLVCRCMMADADDVMLHSTPHQQVSATFIEAF